MIHNVPKREREKATPCFMPLSLCSSSSLLLSSSAVYTAHADRPLYYITAHTHTHTHTHTHRAAAPTDETSGCFCRHAPSLSLSLSLCMCACMCVCVCVFRRALEREGREAPAAADVPRVALSTASEEERAMSPDCQRLFFLSLSLLCRVSVSLCVPPSSPLLLTYTERWPFR